MVKSERTNNDLLNTTQKTKHRAKNRASPLCPYVSDNSLTKNLYTVY